MHQEKLIALTRSILSQPTAPFHEQQVRAEIRQQLEGLRSVTLQEDHFGNLIARYNRGGGRARVAFSAHMDHPGWVRPPDQPEAEMRFLGGVREEFLDKCDVQNFGDFGMWNLPAFDYKDDKIYSRACDDLVGCAAIVALMQELEEKSVPASFVGIFTRAEEVGFLGAIRLAQSSLLSKSLTIISLETSAALPPARLGGGPIIRVGDRTTIFAAEITRQLEDIARKHQIPFQRYLMSGGTCEATAYQLYGFRAGALCIPLENYHNCTQNTGIGREYVSFQDFRGLINLCAAVAQEPLAAGENFQKTLRKALEENFTRHGAFLPNGRKAGTPEKRKPAIVRVKLNGHAAPQGKKTAPVARKPILIQPSKTAKTKTKPVPTRKPERKAAIKTKSVKKVPVPTKPKTPTRSKPAPKLPSRPSLQARSKAVVRPIPKNSPKSTVSARGKKPARK